MITLESIRNAVISSIDPDLLDIVPETWSTRGNVFVFDRKMDIFTAYLYASMQCPPEIVDELQDYAQQIFDSTKIRWYAKSHAVPLCPFGNYSWIFVIRILKHIIWGLPEFEEGFNIRGDYDRRWNPHQIGSSQHKAWDCGLILGQSTILRENDVQAWLDQHAKDLG